MPVKEPTAAHTAPPENLTRCECCGVKFPEPVTDWDEFFVEVEDASFFCESCADREGLE